MLTFRTQFNFNRHSLFRLNARRKNCGNMQSQEDGSNANEQEKLTKRKYSRFRYTEADLSAAIDSVRRNEISANKAAKQYGIPKGTLISKLHGDTPIERRMGPDTVLTQEEEARLEKWILDKASLGFPMHPNEVREAVQKILKAEKRPNPFTDDKPGRKWLKLFLKRHPKIAQKNAEIISKARAAVTEGSIRWWFGKLEGYLEEEDALDILEDGSRQLNLDETGVSLCPKTGKILGLKGSKNLYKVASGPEKQCITVLCTYSADGRRYDPMIVYPNLRLPRDVGASVPEDFVIGKTKNGWMTSDTYYQYLTECLFEQLQDRKVKFPVLIIFDGHKSHINMKLHEFCVQNRILLFCLLPNATHILQPCDVGIFYPLKNEWKKVMQEHSQATTKAITKVTFAPLFKKAFDDSYKPETVRNSFAACGLFPFDPDRVDYSKCISTRRAVLNTQQSDDLPNLTSADVDVNSIVLSVIESYVPPALMEEFEEAYNTTQTPEQEVLLYQIWKSLKNKICEDKTAKRIQVQSFQSDDSFILSQESSYDIFEGNVAQVTFLKKLNLRL